MGSIPDNKTVAFLVPHTDASAFTAMVRLTPPRQKRNLSLSWLESHFGGGISDDKRTLNSTDISVFQSIGYYSTDFCPCRGFFP